LSTILQEYGSLIVAILAVFAMFFIYTQILDKGLIQFNFYNASPLSEYNAKIDAEEVAIGTYDYGAWADENLYSVFNIGRVGESKAPWFSVSNTSETVIPVQDETKEIVEDIGEDWIEEFFIDKYGISVKNFAGKSDVSLDDLLIVEYRPKLNTAVAPDGTTYVAGVVYEWGYALDEYANRIRIGTEGGVVVKEYQDELSEDDFDLDTVVDKYGYLMIPVTRYERYLWTNGVDYASKGGDSFVTDGRDPDIENIYFNTDGYSFDKFDYIQNSMVRYKAVYRVSNQGMKAEHIALFRNSIRLPSVVYPD